MEKLTKRILIYTGLVLFVIEAGISSSAYAASQAGKKSGSASVAKAATKGTASTQGAKVKDPDRVVMQLGNKKLLGWQVDQMMKIGVGPDEASVCDAWVKLQLEAAEAHKRGLDKTKEAKFVISLFRSNYLRGQLEQSIISSLPKVSEAQAKIEYETNKKTYTRPLQATVQHITLQEHNVAEKVVKMARQKGVDFSALVKKYSSAADKTRKGEMKKVFKSQLIRNLGNDAYNAIAKSKKGQILGPFIGRRGFEVIKVISVTPPVPYPFNQIKRSIISRLEGKARNEAIKRMVDNLKSGVKIVKSKELLEAEKKAQQQRERLFGPR